MIESALLPFQAFMSMSGLLPRCEDVSPPGHSLSENTSFELSASSPTSLPLLSSPCYRNAGVGVFELYWMFLPLGGIFLSRFSPVSCVLECLYDRIREL